MMIRLEHIETPLFPMRQMVPALMAAAFYLVTGFLLMVVDDSAGNARMISATASPADFGRFLFSRHWLAIEIASLLLLVALIGALHIGREPSDAEETVP
jgi:NADH-quinone oxidoreductase subunit J